MTEALLTHLSSALTQSLFVAFTGAFLWGAVSILLSPCHLASVPLLVGFLASQAESGRRRVFQLSLLFALGILASIALVGVATASAGRLLGDLGRAGNAAVALVFLLFGLHLMDLVALDWSRPGMPARFRGAAGALAFGSLLGIGLGPCTFAFMAPVLGVVFARAGSDPAGSLGLVGAFGLGHCAVIVLAGTLTQSVERYLGWNENRRILTWLRRACGFLVFSAGIYLLFRGAV